MADISSRGSVMRANEEKKGVRYYVFECNPGMSAHRNAPDSLAVIIFSHLASLRSHAVKHLANVYEVSAWQVLKQFNHNKIISCIDALRDLKCPYFTLHSDRPPCWQHGRSCEIFHDCSAHAHFLEECYESCIVEAIRGGISIPRNVLFNQNRYGVLNEDYWVVPNGNVVVKMSWNGSAYSVATCFQPKAGFKLTWNEVLESLKDSILRQAEGRISWCNEVTWGTPLLPDSRKRKQQLPGIQKIPENNKHKKGKPRNKERGGSRSLTTDCKILEDDFFDE